MIELITKFKENIKNKPVIGPFVKTNDPAFIECMGFAGFDFIIIDMEHGPSSLREAQNLISAAQISDIIPIVRVKENSPTLVGEVLDIGAGGIQVPHVNKIEDIQELIKLARFAPKGSRGICRFVRAAKYSSIDKNKYFKDSNETLIVIQLEGLEALNNLDGILEFGGYDVLFIGPYDLSQSMGVPGEIDHPKVEKKIIDIIKKCNMKNIAVGIFSDTIRDARRWIRLGVKYLSYSVDVGIFYESSRNIIKSILSDK